MIILLLFVSIGLQAQYTVKHNGQIVRYGGLTVQAQADNIPGTPTPPEPEPGSWTNLVSWWKMTEASGGTAYDSHGDDDGTVTNATQSSGGIVFDGTDDEVSVSPSAYGTGDFTIIMRINPTYTAGYGRAVIDGPTGAFEFQIYEGTTFRINIEGGGNTDFTTSALLTPGSWNMLAIVREGSNFRCFANGVFENETLSADFTAGWSDFGIENQTTKADFLGTIRDVCHFSDAKCDEYITAFYNSGSYTDYEDGDPASCGTTGEGILLWYQDFDDMALTSNITDTHIDTAFGPADYYGPFGFGKGDDILDLGGGDHYMRWRFIDGGTGGAAGLQVYKTLNSAKGGPDELDNLTDIWQSITMRFESGFDEDNMGKMPGGFTIGSWITTYNGGVDPWPVLEMGANIRKTYSNIETHRTQMYWYGMDSPWGKNFNWYDPYPGESGSISLGSAWHNFTIHLHLDDNPPDSAESYIEFLYDETLVTRYDSMSFRMHDSLEIDYALWGWFPTSTQPGATDDWHCDINSTALFTFTEGDSTWTGMKWYDYQDSAFVVDVPGWPLDEDTTGWGEFENVWWWVLFLLPPLIKRRKRHSGHRLL